MRRRTSSWQAPVLAITIVLAIVVAGIGFSTGEFDNLADETTLVTTDSVNLRQGPGTDFAVLDVIPAGTEVSVIGEDAGFASVRIDGRQGWISRDYLAAVSRPSYQPPIVSAAEHTSVATEAPTAAQVLAEEQQVQSDPQPGERWIEVNRTTRTVTLHDGEIIVAEFDALIGKDPSPDGYYSTAVGTYQVWVKEKALAETPFAEGVFLTDFVGFDPDRRNGFHSPTRDAEGSVVITGGTQTLGCVRLGESEAQFLFDFAYIGMRVEVHD